MVALRVDLTDEQNETLERLAASRGRTVGELIREGVDVVLGEDRTRLKLLVKRVPSLSEKESDLLLAINRGLPEKVSAHYEKLIRRRQAGMLGPDEHRELLRLTDEMERLQAERMESLSELARLRGVPLSSLMEELEIRPASNA